MVTEEATHMPINRLLDKKMWYMYTKEYLEGLLLSCVQLFCNTMDCSLPVSSAHEISQARILEWVAIPFSSGSSQPRYWNGVFWLAWRKPRINLSTLQNRLPGGSDGKESVCSALGSLGQEDALEKGIVTYSSILAWIIPWTEEPGGLQPMRSLRVGRDWVTFIFALTLQNTQKIPSLGTVGTSVPESMLGCLMKGKLVGSC